MCSLLALTWMPARRQGLLWRHGAMNLGVELSVTVPSAELVAFIPQPASRLYRAPAAASARSGRSAASPYRSCVRLRRLPILQASPPPLHTAVVGHRPLRRRASPAAGCCPLPNLTSAVAGATPFVASPWPPAGAAPPIRRLASASARREQGHDGEALPGQGEPRRPGQA